jgi:hypothetical protein
MELMEMLKTFLFNNKQKNLHVKQITCTARRRDKSKSFSECYHSVQVIHSSCPLSQGLLRDFAVFLGVRCLVQSGLQAWFLDHSRMKFTLGVLRQILVLEPTEWSLLYLSLALDESLTKTTVHNCFGLSWI